MWLFLLSSKQFSLTSSDSEPISHLALHLLYLRLLGLRDRKLFARIRLRDQVVLTSLVLHDARQRLLIPNIQLQSEVLRHQVVLPAAERARD